MIKNKKQELIIFFLLLGVTFLVWLSTLSLGFFSDDYHFLYITSLQENVFKYFLTNNVGELTGGSYGPILNIIFTIQYKIFGIHAFWYHVVSLLVYTGIAYALYNIVKKITDNKTIAFVSSFLFILLPNHVEAIAWVAVQPHIFATFFFIVGLYIYYQFVCTKKMWRYILSLVLFSLSIFTKETAIMFPCILILVELFFGDQDGFLNTSWRIVKRMIPVSLLFGLFLFLRYSIVGYVAGYYAQESLGFALVPKIKMFIELTVSMFVSSPYRQIVSHWFFDHKFILLCVIAFILILMQSVHRKYRKPLWFLLLSYVILSVPFLSLIFNPMHDGGERYTFLISLFGIAYFITLIFALTKDKKLGNIIFIGCITIFVLTSLSQLNPKLNTWKVSVHVRDTIFDDIREYNYENTEIADHFVFVGLPDNIDGAESMRNAIKEAIYFETDFGFVSGERIPLYSEFNLTQLNRLDVTLEKSDDHTYVFTSVNEEEIFTGFKEYKFNFGTAVLGNFVSQGHSGNSIILSFDKERLENYEATGYALVIVYFDGKNIQFVPVNE